MARLVEHLHQADHWDTPDQAEVAARTSKVPELVDWDYRVKRHRNGYVVRLETPVSEGRIRVLGYLVKG